jgi:hypothetical protein
VIILVVYARFKSRLDTAVNRGPIRLQRRGANGRSHEVGLKNRRDGPAKIDEELCETMPNTVQQELYNNLVLLCASIIAGGGGCNKETAFPGTRAGGFLLIVHVVRFRFQVHDQALQ